MQKGRCWECGGNVVGRPRHCIHLSHINHFLPEENLNLTLDLDVLSLNMFISSFFLFPQTTDLPDFHVLLAKLPPECGHRLLLVLLHKGSLLHLMTTEEEIVETYFTEAKVSLQELVPIKGEIHNGGLQVQEGMRNTANTYMICFMLKITFHTQY